MQLTDSDNEMTWKNSCLSLRFLFLLKQLRNWRFYFIKSGVINVSHAHPALSFPPVSPHSSSSSGRSFRTSCGQWSSQTAPSWCTLEERWMSGGSPDPEATSSTFCCSFSLSFSFLLCGSNLFYLQQTGADHCYWVYYSQIYLIYFH